MEQAEQFFRASDTVGKEIRPILLYYGLNQALRALAAACIPWRETWTFNSHGLSCRNIDQIKDLEHVTIEESGQGAFQMLTRIDNYRDSVTEERAYGLPGKVLLGDVWASLPEGSLALLQNSNDRWSAITVEQSDTSGQNSGPRAFVTSLPASTDGMRFKDLDPLIYERYPAIKNAQLRLVGFRDDDDVVEAPPWDVRPSVLLTPEKPVYKDDVVHALFKGKAEGYEKSQDGRNRPRNWLIPCLAGNKTPFGSLATWWTVLHALSVVARYAPSKWTAMLDINNSADASNIEYVLSDAHSRCIEILRKKVIHADLYVKP